MYWVASLFFFSAFSTKKNTEKVKNHRLREIVDCVIKLMVTMKCNQQTGQQITFFYRDFIALLLAVNLIDANHFNDQDLIFHSKCHQVMHKCCQSWLLFIPLDVFFCSFKLLVPTDNRYRTSGDTEHGYHDCPWWMNKSSTAFK